MTKTPLVLLLSTLACACLPQAMAQSQATSCPALPQSARVHWESNESGSVCRAMDAEGRQIFGLMFTDEPMRLARNLREEEGMVGSHEVRWYRPRVAGDTSGERRVATLELEDGSYAQIWIDAGSEGQLEQAFSLAQALQL